MFAELLTRIAAALDGRGVPYMVIGGQAVLVHGEPRLTRDIDITVGVGPDRIDEILAMVSDLGLVPLPQDPKDFAAQTMVLPAVDGSTGIRIDLILSLSTYEAEAIGRAQAIEMEGGAVRFATAEDLVVHKIIAGRPRDLEDVRSVLLKNPALDRDYVKGWLRSFEAAIESEQDEGPLETFARIDRSIE